MINPYARRAAKSIYEGRAPTPEDHPKIALYGILARALDVERLGTTWPLVPAKVSFAELEEELRQDLADIGEQGYLALPSTDRRLAESYWERVAPDPSLVLGRASLYATTKMILGAGTAAERVTIGLRTIAKEIHAGVIPSEESLQASSRVPYKQAMNHLIDLKRGQRTYDRRWSTPEGDGGLVLAEEATMFDPHSGLSLTTTLHEGHEVARMQHGPQIGCPATLVPGYIQTVHEIAALSAVELGLLDVSS